ncbi:hypothetical protein LAZ67_X001501 [Cordylochernes scorpioides]|uniref:Reverse transcriptase domain-containing protein n=1 Tax=Cordylochernes scorpioides TaxID=51811 RepID=A0ABY6LWQ8_9ARAC|nr:hypothetical protein LAZ67_X001501 [Cordylochernes scorpioides]
MREITEEISRLKNCKAAGIDEVPNEAIKLLPHSYLLLLKDLYNRILRSAVFLSSFSKSIIHPILKNGDSDNPSNYRGISLLSNFTKLFIAILRSRLVKWIETNDIIPENQAGFRSAHSCQDHIFILTSVIQLALRKKRGKCYSFFVDFKKAFDTVPQALLWTKLVKIGLNHRFVKLIKCYYENMTAAVRWNNSITEFIEIRSGVLQGDPLSPCLVLLFINDLIKIFDDSGLSGRYLPNFRNIHLLLYADDIVLIGDSKINLQLKINILKTYLETNLLTLNEKKSRIMVFRNGGKVARSERWYWLQSPLSVTSKYTYLGYPLTPLISFTQVALNYRGRTMAAMGAVEYIILRSKIKSFHASGFFVQRKHLKPPVKPVYSSKYPRHQRVSNIEETIVLRETAMSFKRITTTRFSNTKSRSQSSSTGYHFSAVRSIGIMPTWLYGWPFPTSDMWIQCHWPIGTDPAASSDLAYGTLSKSSSSHLTLNLRVELKQRSSIVLPKQQSKDGTHKSGRFTIPTTGHPHCHMWWNAETPLTSGQIGSEKERRWRNKPASPTKQPSNLSPQQETIFTEETPPQRTSAYPLTDRQRREQADRANDSPDIPASHGNRATMWPKPCDKFHTFDLPSSRQCSRQQATINFTDATSVYKLYMERLQRQQEYKPRPSFLTELSHNYLRVELKQRSSIVLPKQQSKDGTHKSGRFTIPTTGHPHCHMWWNAETPLTPGQSTVKNWVAALKLGRISTEDEHRPGRSVESVTQENIDKIHDLVMLDRRMTVRQIEETLGIPKTTADRIIIILGLRKLSARWVPKLLTPDQKAVRRKLSSDNLALFEANPEEFVNRFVTMNETWAHHFTPESKQQSMQWRHSGSPPLKKAKTVPSAGKVMVSVFWNSEGVLLLDFLNKGQTIIDNHYAILVKQLREAIKEKRTGRLSRKIVYHQDNAPSHRSLQAMAAIYDSGFELLTHAPYSPDIAPSDFHLFPHLKRSLSGIHFRSD